MRHLLAIASLLLAACANLQTVDRSTTLPGEGTKHGKAVHLDAQQRLLVVRNKSACAEPSPDALAAYAASLGFGISAQTQGAASLANAVESSAGSIGLRTQSITLMRDALYRVCEMYANGGLSDIDVATFLTRSQDLTVAVLAIEQLTGAVVGPAVKISSNASGSGSAALLANAQVLVEARKWLADTEKKLTEAKVKQTNAAGAENQAMAAVNKANSELNVLEVNLRKMPPQATQAQVDAKNAELTTLKRELDAAITKRVSADTEVRSLTQEVASAKETETQIDQEKSSLTSANANASGIVTGTATTHQRLDAQSITAVGMVVDRIVDKVVNKNYIVETCLAYLSRPPRDVSTMSEEDQDKYEVQRDAILTSCADILAKVALAGGMAAAAGLTTLTQPPTTTGTGTAIPTATNLAPAASANPNP